MFPKIDPKQQVSHKMHQQFIEISKSSQLQKDFNTVKLSELNLTAQKAWLKKSPTFFISSKCCLDYQVKQFILSYSPK